MSDTVKVLRKDGSTMVIPASELASGMMRVRLGGEGGEQVWMDPKEIVIQDGFQHPPFEEATLQAIRDIYDVVGPFYAIGLDKFVEGFRKDKNPAKEIAVWKLLSQRLQQCFKDEALRKDEKQEVFKIFLQRTTCSTEHVFETTRLGALKATNARRLLQKYWDTPPAA